jgi:hypothetical protein
MASHMYFALSHPASFRRLNKFHTAAKKTGVTRNKLKTWLEQQDTYTLHRPVRKRFPRNPYTVSNVLDFWECDLVDMQAFRKYNNGYKYLLTAIDVFSKFLHIVPLKSKIGKDVTSAFLRIFIDPK